MHLLTTLLSWCSSWYYLIPICPSSKQGYRFAQATTDFSLHQTSSTISACSRSFSCWVVAAHIFLSPCDDSTSLEDKASKMKEYQYRVSVCTINSTLILLKSTG
uniref:Uncharacterized protein n=1 Tax=Arundo donax TaxID=35708 RepID=A0A0A9H0V2_ARUDO